MGVGVMGDQWSDGEANDGLDGLTREDYDWWLWTDEMDDGSVDLRDLHPSRWPVLPTVDDDYDDIGDGWIEDGEWDDARRDMIVGCVACVLSAVGVLYLAWQVIRWAGSM